MALTMEKAVKELIATLKKENFPGETKKSYWNKLTEQLAEDGSWEDEVINQTKEEVAAWLGKLKKNDLAGVWEESEIAVEEYEDEDTPEKDTVIEELSDELLDVVLNIIEDSAPKEEYYIPEAGTGNKKKFDDDDDFDDDFKDNFDDDDMEDFGGDDYFDDDRY